jgi:hypothetical protein
MNDEPDFMELDEAGLGAAVVNQGSDAIIEECVFPQNQPDMLFFCPSCGGPHFHFVNSGTLICSSVSFKDNERVNGCGWKGKVISG